MSNEALNSSIAPEVEQSKKYNPEFSSPEQIHVEWEPATEQDKVGLRIVEALQNSEAEAYFVGGYGRDLIMSQQKEQYPDMRFKPNDIDIATNLPYEQVKEILENAGFDNFKETGRNFSVLVMKEA